MTTAKIKEVAAPVHVDHKPKFESVVDSRGRTIQLRTLDPLQQARLVIAVGGEIAANNVFMSGFALPAARVAHIDDAFYGLPATMAQIESMISALGTEGMEAIADNIIAKHKAALADQASTALAAEQAAAKN